MQQQPLPRPGSLRRHLAWALLAKAVMLSIIWFAWFRAPVAPEPRQIASALLSSPATGCQRQDPCDAA